MDKDKLARLESKYLKTALPEFEVGDTIEVDMAVREGEKVRIQTFAGTVIRRRGQGTGVTFTVRKISYGEGVEKTFPLHSPVLKDIRVVKKGKVRRSKLYYLRSKTGKQARLKEKILSREETTIDPASQKDQ